MLRINASSDNLKFKNPGPAISTFLKSLIFLIINVLILTANSFGLILLIFPKIKHTLQDKSKLNEEGGIST